MTGQSVVKHFLTEGDKFLVSQLSPLEDQGGYAIASNYGVLTVTPTILPPHFLPPPVRSPFKTLLVNWSKLLTDAFFCFVIMTIRLVGGTYCLSAH